MGVKFCWHGCASFSLRMYGQEFLFDPFFALAGASGAGRTANGNAPSPADYLRAHWPDLCLITGCRYDHCDLETVRRLGMMRPQLRFLAADGVVADLRRACALADACVWPTEVGDVYHMGTVRVETLAGRLDPDAPLSGDGRGAQAGALPVRGAAGPEGACRPGPLGFHMTADADRVYVSGDTTLSGIPPLDATIAVLCVGGRGARAGDAPPADPHPPILGEDDVAAAARRLSARVVIPIHWDFQGFATRLDIHGLQRRLAVEMPAVSVIVPPYNQWIEVEA